MFLRSAIVVISFISFDKLAEGQNISTGNLKAATISKNFSISPPLTDFINKTELTLLQNSGPQEQVEWINASLGIPWTSYKESPEEPKRARDLDRRLSRRYVDVTRCTDSRRRVILRNEVRYITQMILSAQTNMTIAHPVWRALISPAFQQEPRALQRMKGLFKTLYDTIIDSEDIVGLECNIAKSKCHQTREAPGTGREQVPAAYYNLDENVINLCDAFFGYPQLEEMSCRAGQPMSAYDAMPTMLLHEIVHGIFQPLATTNYDFITFDLAYGFGACADLAQGTCTTAESGIRCSPLATIANVDTIVWLIYGFYWYNECSREGKKIPLY